MKIRLNIRRRVEAILFWIVVAAAFCAGYLVYPLRHAQPPINGDQADMTVFWEAWQILSRDFIGDKPDAFVRVHGAAQGLAASFGDPFTIFVEPQSQELQDDSLKGKFGGIGATIEKIEDGFLLNPIADQPADKAGIRQGDRLLKVDDTVITTTMTTDDVVAHVRGEVGVAVALLVERTYTDTNTSEELNFSVVRAELELPSIEWALIDKVEGFEAAGAIGYIHQTIVSERSPGEMRQALEALRLAGARRFIWDLRGNPGGLVKAAVDLVDIWLSDGLILLERRADGTELRFTAQPGGEAAKAPLVLIVNGGSASAAEIIAGALQDHKRALVVGQKTYGKGSVQLIYTLTDGSSLHVTNAQWFTPNNHQISGQGLLPDVIVAEGQDPLQVAIEQSLGISEN
jgi:carboxyl-terminal processing protease